MLSTLLIAFAVIAAVAYKWLIPQPERCPDCNLVREDEGPICSCGWIFETVDDDPLEYGAPDDDM